MLNDEQLKSIFQNAVKSDDFISLLNHFISLSDPFRKGIAKDERTECYLRGKAFLGLYIRDLFLQYAPETYTNLLTQKEN